MSRYNGRFSIILVITCFLLIGLILWDVILPHTVLITESLMGHENKVMPICSRGCDHTLFNKPNQHLQDDGVDWNLVDRSAPPSGEHESSIHHLLPRDNTPTIYEDLSDWPEDPARVHEVFSPAEIHCYGSGIRDNKREQYNGAVDVCVSSHGKTLKLRQAIKKHFTRWVFPYKERMDVEITNEFDTDGWVVDKNICYYRMKQILDECGNPARGRGGWVKVDGLKFNIDPNIKFA